jgi:adenine-specific DNA-methyltransferase
MCDEVFGEINFVSQIAWRKSDNQANIGNIARVKEYILLYAKNTTLLNLNKMALTNKAKKEYRYQDEKGFFRRDILLHKTRGRHVYHVTTPSGKILEGPWMKKENDFTEMDRCGRIYWTKGGDEQPYGKIYLNDSDGQISNDFLGIEFGTNQQASLEVENLFGARFFDFPKSTMLLKHLISIGANTGDIVLDFYSGSATTAHAVTQLNVEDGGNRKYIMVQLPEQTSEKSEAYNAGYKNICEIGKERIRRAANKIKKEKLVKAEKDGLFADSEDTQDYGFRVYRLTDSNMQDIYYRPQDYKQEMLDMFADNIKPDRSPDDLLAQVMLDWGLPLSYKIEQATINDKQVFKVAQDSLIVCFDKGIDEAFTKEIAKEKPLRVVFRDSGFVNDTTKTNVQQLLKQLSPETEMKVI